MSEKTTAYWLRQFADAAEKDPEGWASWFQSYSGSAWRIVNAQQLILDAIWYPSMIRHKPRRITISGSGGEYSYPEPMKTAPVCDTGYWTPTRGLDALAVHHVWTGSGADYNRLRRGLCHAEQSAAREHAIAEIRAAGFEP